MRTRPHVSNTYAFIDGIGSAGTIIDIRIRDPAAASR